MARVAIKMTRKTPNTAAAVRTMILPLESDDVGGLMIDVWLVVLLIVVEEIDGDLCGVVVRKVVVVVEGLCVVLVVDVVDDLCTGGGATESGSEKIKDHISIFGINLTKWYGITQFCIILSSKY